MKIGGKYKKYQEKDLCVIFLNIEKYNNLNFTDIKKHEQYPNSNRNFQFMKMTRQQIY